jgi:hypothetical protein
MFIDNYNYVYTNREFYSLNVVNETSTIVLNANELTIDNAKVIADNNR